jgi:hypothetical protein
MSFRIVLLSGFLIALALGIFYYKSQVLSIPIFPESNSATWAIESSINFKTKGTNAKVSMFLPSSSNTGEIITENFISDGFGLGKIISEGGRRAVWTKSKITGEFQLYYQAVIKPVLKLKNQKIKKAAPVIDMKMNKKQKAAAEAIVQQASTIVRNSKDSKIEATAKALIEIVQDKNSIPEVYKPLLEKIDSPKSEVKVIAQLLRTAGYTARAVHGINLVKTARKASIFHWIEIFQSGSWKAFNVSTKKYGVPDTYFPWWRGNLPLVELEGVEQEDHKISVVKQDSLKISSAIAKAEKNSRVLGNLALTRLPYQTQAVYRLILLIPIGALVVAFLRNFVGIKTFGTFMPVLIALAFRETTLLWGLLLFVAIISLGLLVRTVLDRLQLLLVPRLTAILTTVILILVLLSSLSQHFSFSHGLSVALFPIVILTMTIERMSVLWEEKGLKEAVKTAVGSMCVASLVYLVITNDFLTYFIFVFPEFLLVNLALAILLGRYTGYRLLELKRFKALEFGGAV